MKWGDEEKENKSGGATSEMLFVILDLFGAARMIRIAYQVRPYHSKDELTLIVCK
jgi:hypothetical protein